MTDHHVSRAKMPEAIAQERIAVKRILLSMMIAAQVLAYKVLTDARYEGQGLSPVFLRLSTMSDIASLLFPGLVIGLIIAAIVRPERIGLLRCAIVSMVSAILLWLDYGIRRTPAEEFGSEAGGAILLVMCALLATLAARSRTSAPTGRRLLMVGRNILALTILTVMAPFTFAFFYPTYSRVEDISAFNADAGVVFGAAVWRGKGLGDRPSPTLKERIDLGYDLLQQHAVPRIVVTGASAPGELAEAEIAKRAFVNHGVDPSQIIEESNSHTTLEQVRFLHDELYQQQHWSRFVIISDQYHLARVVDMCRFNGLHAIGSPSRIHQPAIDLLYYRVRESVALLEYWMLGR